MANETEVKKCADCIEHSGVISTVEQHSISIDRLVTKFDKFVDEANRHRTQMLVGIILCLCAGLLSVYFSYEAQSIKFNNGASSACPYFCQESEKGEKSWL